jgi:hypothetical protein
MLITFGKMPTRSTSYVVSVSATTATNVCSPMTAPKSVGAPGRRDRTCQQIRKADLGIRICLTVGKANNAVKQTASISVFLMMCVRRRMILSPVSIHTTIVIIPITVQGRIRYLSMAEGCVKRTIDEDDYGHSKYDDPGSSSGEGDQLSSLR